MDHILLTLHSSGVQSDTLLQHMREIPFDDDMKAACRLMSDHQSVTAIILSDSNTVFIETILSHANLGEVFSRTVTNPAQLLADGRLTVQRYHQHSCSLCPPNLCKGSVMEEFVKENGFRKVVYVGDGGGDLCPSLRLSEQDTLLARTGYTLSRELQSWPRTVEEATTGEKCPFCAQLVLWSSGRDVLDFMESWLKDNAQCRT